MKSKVLAIYLPQYHAIPENDKWWGAGFTEWTNVKRGRPFYPGHYQPRIPLKGEYYDLSDLKVLEKHTRMARKAGISGFCFYHYYICGKKLLEKPVENYRDKSRENFPYCLIWANQSWARTWYRATKDKEVLLRQSYGTKEDWEMHFYYLLDFFRDKRYIKIRNKPVYIIYMPQDIHVRRQMFHVWDGMAKAHGFDGIYLIAMNTSCGKDSHTELYDAYMDFEPMYTVECDSSWRKWLRNKKYEMRKNIKFDRKRIWNGLLADNVYSYSYLSKRALWRFGKSDVKTYAGVFAGWDNTSRKDEDGLIVRGGNPKRFGVALEKCLRLSEKQRKQFVFINAWNEWSEGAYIEPDERYGYACLNRIKRNLAGRGK
mgnify:CR=1 FL=1